MKTRIAILGACAIALLMPTSWAHASNTDLSGTWSVSDGIKKKKPTTNRTSRIPAQGLYSTSPVTSVGQQYFVGHPKTSAAPVTTKPYKIR